MQDTAGPLSVQVNVGEGDVVEIVTADGFPHPLFQVVLTVPGGELSYDMRDLTLPWLAVVHDSFSARWWVDALYGDPVLEAVEAAAASAGVGDQDPHAAGGGAADPGTVVDPNSAGSGLARLALGLWIRRFWPSPADDSIGPLDERLLDAELAALAWESELLLGPHLARTLVEPLVPWLVGRGPELLAGTAPLPVARVLHRAVTGAQNTLPNDHRLIEAVDDLAVALDARVGDPAAHVSVATARPVISVREMALAAGEDQDAGSTPPARFTLDWMQVPRRVFDWGDDTVEVVVLASQDDGTSAVDVRVLLGADGRLGPDEVNAHLYSGGEHVVSGALTDLTHDDGWAGVTLTAPSAALARGSWAVSIIGADVLDTRPAPVHASSPQARAREMLRRRWEAARGAWDETDTVTGPFAAEWVAARTHDLDWGPWA
ncbi:MAG: hypothetical protein ACK5MT_17365 [Actinomycetales bacterium]